MTWVQRGGVKVWDGPRDEEEAGVCASCGSESGGRLCQPCASSEANRREWCRRGHRRTPDNVYANRSCRRCALDQRREWREAARLRRLEKAVADHWTAP